MLLVLASEGACAEKTSPRNGKSEKSQKFLSKIWFKSKCLFSSVTKVSPPKEVYKWNYTAKPSVVLVNFSGSGDLKHLKFFCILQKLGFLMPYYSSVIYLFFPPTVSWFQPMTQLHLSWKTSGKNLSLNTVNIDNPSVPSAHEKCYWKHRTASTENNEM